jgi:biopolymer transport protein ExbB/TolQ
MGVNLVELWGTMGWFAKGIVYVLLIMSVYVMAIAGRKLLDLSRARKATLKFSPAFSAALAQNNFTEAEKLIDAKAHKRSHVAALFKRVLSNLDLASRKPSGEDIAAAESLLELNGLEQLAYYRRGLGVMATVGSTAPFVGLLGTTMGVVTAFTGMAEAGAGGLGAISAGIAEALITTAFGLLVAIPAVWLYNYFTNRIDLVSMEMSYTTREFLDFVQAHVRGVKGRV